MARRANFRFFLTTASLGAAVLLSSCWQTVDKTGPANAQGWTPGNQAFWYETSQGSRLIPLAWYNALERENSTEPFSDQQYIATFGYLPSDPERLEKRGENLPIGFAIDQQKDGSFIKTKLDWYAGQNHGKKSEPWVGMNCSACHTAEILYEGKPHRIDGAPGMGDYQSFINAFDAALKQTMNEDDKFDRFAAKVLEGKDDADNRAMLKTALTSFVGWEDKIARVNGDRPGGVVRSGYGRVDAIGHIFNKIALYNQADPQPGNPSDAPVSYPFLWDITKQKKVQWNGSAENQRLKLGKGELDYGAMGRNAGEVYGVFGEVVIPDSKKDDFIRQYKSSVRIKELNQLEVAVSLLKPPAWPDSFPALDTDKVSKGRSIYTKLKCNSCHVDREDWEEGEPIERMITFKSMAKDTPSNLTDIWMACNAATYVAPTGNLEGGKMGIVKGEQIGEVAPVFNQLAFSVKAGLIQKKGDLIKLAGQIFLGIEEPPVIQGDDDPLSFLEEKLARGERCVKGVDENDNPLPKKTMAIMAYKARPLDGIWATAPYLHNGSVPTLYHLLLAPKDRPKTFYIGSREYDAALGGYIWKDPQSGPHSKFETVDASGKEVLGNSNAGHDYGVGTLSQEDRLALLEYMKSL